MKNGIADPKIDLQDDAAGAEYTFPALVYKEWIAILLATAVLCVWSLAADAPLRAVADPNWTENPAKAPWYFVGLQELLVYFDPWIAGVMIPGLIIFGLAALPYLDVNPHPPGTYNVRNRRLVSAAFLYGFGFWFLLIAVGQYLRGPSWHLYWPWEDRAVEKTIEESLFSLPNSIGAALLLMYYAAGMAAPAWFRPSHFRAMGFVRYVVAWFLALSMLGIAGKILLRLLLNIKYIISTPFFSI